MRVVLLASRSSPSVITAGPRCQLLLPARPKPLGFFPAACHDILDRGRCNCNAAEPRSELQLPHTVARFALIRSSLARIRAA